MASADSVVNSLISPGCARFSATTPRSASRMPTPPTPSKWAIDAASFSASTAASSVSLELKWCSTPAWLSPAASAISRSDEPWKPRTENASSAVRRISARRASVFAYGPRVLHAAECRE